MAKLYKVDDKRCGEPDYYFQCPGCDCDHGIWTSNRNGIGAVWSFNGDIEKPTVMPSIKVTYPTQEPHPNNICHSFIKDGKIQYLGDCTHKLANQTIELPDYD